MQIAIFIDFHNLYMMLGKSAGNTIDAVAEIMKMGRRRGEIAEALMFVPIYLYDHRSRSKDKMWDLINNLSLTFGLETKACPVSRIGTPEGIRMKDSVDSCVLTHVIRHVHKNIGPELIIFVTGDGDFLKFSTEAENRGKRTEFWAIDPSSTNRIIRQEGNFKEIVVSPPNLQENLFLVALDKMLKGAPLELAEKQALALVAKVPGLKFREQEIVDMLSLISHGLDISFESAQKLLDMLINLGVADINLAIKRVVNIDYLHSIFGRIRSQMELEVS